MRKKQTGFHKGFKHDQFFCLHYISLLSTLSTLYVHVDVSQGVALQNIALALAVVFLSIGALSGFAIAWIVTLLVLCTTLGTVGLVRLLALRHASLSRVCRILARCCIQYGTTVEH